MEGKNKKELLAIIDEKNKRILTYKTRLHDLIESYKHLVKEKEALEISIKTLTEANGLLTCDQEINPSTNESNKTEIKDVTSEKRDVACLQMLKSSFGALAIEKTRVENELRADRKKILQEKDEVEKYLVESENNCFFQKEKYENQIQEMKKKISSQQREREKEQQDHALMLKEMQNILASERAAKEKLDIQVSELQYLSEKCKLPEKRALEYEKCIDELKCDIKTLTERLKVSENKCKKNLFAMQKLQEGMNENKVQYCSTLEEEKKRADEAEEKLQLLTIVKEKRITTLEAHLSELSTMVGNYDKMRQQDHLAIQRLKERIAQLHNENSSRAKIAANDEVKNWESEDLTPSLGNQMKHLKAIPKLQNTKSEITWNANDSEKEDTIVEINHHAKCHFEILQLKEELEQYKIKAESALKEKYNKTSAALLSDAKANKEIKELKSRMNKLQEQHQTCKSQLKLGEEYHNKITTNLEKFIEELKLQHKQDKVRMESDNRAKIMELEHQIQKQRERTLSLLEEKDKEISLLKASFLPHFRKKEVSPAKDMFQETIEASTSDQLDTTNILSHSLISSKKDGHLLHYIQELARKDVEISNLRHCRIQAEATLRKSQQNAALMEENYVHELESLKSRVQLMESSKSQDFTNVEYLKNVILRFLKCTDPGTRRHMVNAIATVLHFTSNELQEVKTFVKAL